ncbi:MAG: hypothetical protein H0V74_00060 [Chloroflexi bacterium]|nr:hypothetical protein [Chloroflexota bacterium]
MNALAREFANVSVIFERPVQVRTMITRRARTRDTLRSVRRPILNLHMGITPMYRGAHGGYWALVDRRPDLVGTTIHLVGEGIDTGAIIEQVRSTVEEADSFATYPYLHLAAGIPALIRAVRAGLAGDLQPMRTLPVVTSKLRTHPTLWGYLAPRLARGIR